MDKKRRQIPANQIYVNPNGGKRHILKAAGLSRTMCGRLTYYTWAPLGLSEEKVTVPWADPGIGWCQSCLDSFTLSLAPTEDYDDAN
jgi:hypothetical protein